MTLEFDKTISEQPRADTKSPSQQQAADRQNTSSKKEELPADHFAVRNGVEFAGTHIIIDFWGAKPLNDLELMEVTLRKAVEASGATLLHIHLHHFSPGGGISGVAVLAESHISVHTWPERDFAAFDIFMCGDAEPEAAIPVFRDAFCPEKIDISEHLRGMSTESTKPE